MPSKLKIVSMPPQTLKNLQCNPMTCKKTNDPNYFNMKKKPVNFFKKKKKRKKQYSIVYFVNFRARTLSLDSSCSYHTRTRL